MMERHDLILTIWALCIIASIIIIVIGYQLYGVIAFLLTITGIMFYTFSQEFPKKEVSK